MGGGLGGQGHAAGGRVSPSEGRDHSGWPACTPGAAGNGLYVTPARRLAGSTGPQSCGDPHPKHPPVLSLIWAWPLSNLICCGTPRGEPGPQCALCLGSRTRRASWAAHSFSCSGGSGDWLSPSWSWFWSRTCLSLSRRRCSSSSRLHCGASLRDRERRSHLGPHLTSPVPAGLTGAARLYGGPQVPIFKIGSCEMVMKLPSAGRGPRVLQAPICVCLLVMGAPVSRPREPQTPSTRLDSWT